MTGRLTFWLCGLLATLPLASAQTGGWRVPQTVEAGRPFSIPTAGEGKAVFYLVGPAQVLRRDVQPGETIRFAPGVLRNAGHYVALLVGSSAPQRAEIDVLAAAQPANLSFLAKPSRLPVDLSGGISGVVYVFDDFRNLVLAPLPVSFELSAVGTAVQSRTAPTENGVAWVKMNSAPKAGLARFEARVGNITEQRVVQQVSGDPCNLKMNARPEGQKILLETVALLDCRGNAVPDGTIVTFTETHDGASEATVDVPLKHGVARTEMPAYSGAVLSVATGVVMGNEIRLGVAR